MEERDQGLKYQSELIKVNHMIKQIQELGINTRRIEIIKEKIEQELKTEVDRITNQYELKESIEDLLKEGSFQICYNKAISNLTTLKLKLLEEYNIYSKIHGSCLSIESNLDNLEEINLPIMLNLMLETLKNLKKSSTINYEEEKELVEKVYQLAYRLIKIELIYKNESTLLTKILQNEVDTNFIEKYLLEEISTLDVTKEENKNILNKMKSLKKKGLESTYLDLELLNLLKYQNNPELMEQKKNFVLTTYTTLEKQLSQKKLLENQYQDLEMKYQRYKKEKRTIQKSLLKYSSYFALSLSIISGTVIGIGTAVKKACSYKTYATTIQTYDAEKDQFSEVEEYLEQAENTTYLKQYFPYEDTGKEVYTYEREIYTYDISDIYYESLKDYTSISLEEFHFAPEITKEHKTTLNPSDYYQTPRTIIERTKVDQNNIQYEMDNFNFIMDSFISLFFPVSFECIFFGCDGFWVSKLKKQKELWNFIKMDIDRTYQSLLELEKKLKLQSQTEQQLLSSIAKEYNTLPASITKEKEWIKIKKKLKEPTQNI